MQVKYTGAQMNTQGYSVLLTVIGLCTDDVDETSAPLMILEYMPFGDLLNFLQTYRYIAGYYPEILCVFS